MKYKGYYIGWSLMGVLCSNIGFVVSSLTRWWIGVIVFCVLFFVTYFLEVEKELDNLPQPPEEGENE